MKLKKVMNKLKTKKPGQSSVINTSRGIYFPVTVGHSIGIDHR